MYNKRIECAIYCSQKFFVVLLSYTQFFICYKVYSVVRFYLITPFE